MQSLKRVLDRLARCLGNALPTSGSERECVCVCTIPSANNDVANNTMIVYVLRMGSSTCIQLDSDSVSCTDVGWDCEARTR